MRRRGERGPAKRRKTEACKHCGNLHTWKNSLGQYCSTKCKDRARSARRDIYAERKPWIRKRAKILDEIKLAKGCENPECKWNGPYHPKILDFDHVNPDEKDFNISRALNGGMKFEKILVEVAKCRVLCANCHRADWAQAIVLRSAVVLASATNGAKN